MHPNPSLSPRLGSVIGAVTGLSYRPSQEDPGRWEEITGADPLELWDDANLWKWAYGGGGSS